MTLAGGLALSVSVGLHCFVERISFPQEPHAIIRLQNFQVICSIDG